MGTRGQVFHVPSVCEAATFRETSTVLTHIPHMALEEPGVEGLGRRVVVLEAWALQRDS